MYKIITITLLGVSLVTLTGCSYNSNEMYEPHGSSQIVPVENENGYTHGDLMFIEGMIPHHEQAVEMSKLALTNTTNPEILKIANNIIAAQSTEIVTLNEWLGQTNDMQHGMKMADSDMGMMDSTSMAKLSSLKDTDFDKLYLQGMIAHHEGAIKMAENVSESKNSKVANFAKKVVEAQTAEIQHMKTLL